MFIDYDTFRERADRLSGLISAACRASGRPPGSVTLLPVTKTHPAEAARYAFRYGFAAVGENRVQEAVDKRAQVRESLRWELIGHLQSNKAKQAAMHFDRVQSVDSAKLLLQLDRAAGELGRTLPVLLQINAGADPAKFGADLAGAPALLATALALPHLRVEGLMTVAPLGATPEATADLAKLTFTNLRELRDRLAAQFHTPLAELSMGMTGDFALAIAAGSTVVRVGTALYGPRDQAPAA